MGDDSVDFAAKGLNSDWEGGSFFFVSDVMGEKEEIRRNMLTTHTAAISGPSEH